MSNLSTSSNLFFEKIKQHKNCDNVYEFCLSSSNFESAEAIDSGLAALAANFLYSIATFSAQKLKSEVGRQRLDEDEEEKMLKAWRLIFNKRENDAIKENEQFAEFVGKYSQDIKTLFNLLRKDKVAQRFIQRLYKTSKGAPKQDKENGSKPNLPPAPKAYKIKHHRSGLGNKHDYVVRMSATTQGSFKARTEGFKKTTISNNAKKLTTAKSFPVDLESTKPKRDQAAKEPNRRLLRLNTINLGNSLFK